VKRQRDPVLTVPVDASARETVNLDKVAIGRRMALARRSLKMTQDELAGLIGATSKRGIQDNEGGRSMPGGNVLGAFVSLDINANWLLTGVGPMRTADLLQRIEVAVPAKLNVPALTAILKGLLEAGAPPDKAVAAAFEFYQTNIERGLITPEGIGNIGKEAA